MSNVLNVGVTLTEVLVDWYRSYGATALCAPPFSSIRHLQRRSV
jgi:hypothetical protein